MNTFILKDVSVLVGDSFLKGDIFVENGLLTGFGSGLCRDGVPVFKFNNAFVFPGLVDVHVHFREPGFSYKETIATGSAAAARGGFTAVCPMPNLDPVPHDKQTLGQELEAIGRSAAIRVLPYGAITRDQLGRELADFESMDSAIAFSDDGHGVAGAEMMEGAMLRAKSLGKLISAHCEDETVPDPSSPRREWQELERNIKLSEKTGCGLHMCHLSCKESLALVRGAKAKGLNVTCETAPHYLTLDNTMIEDHGRFKMNPPIRTPQDREALIEGIKDGTIDMIATDHAPHSEKEKSLGFEKSLNGIVGLETSFAVMYTKLVLPGIISLSRLIELMSDNPRKRFGIPGGIEVGKAADFAVFDLDTEYYVNPSDFLSLGRSTPFEGWKLKGRCLMTVAGGNIAWQEK